VPRLSEAEEFWPDPDRKDFDLHTGPAGYEEMSASVRERHDVDQAANGVTNSAAARE
jgi:hypothetical protein